MARNKPRVLVVGSGGVGTIAALSLTLNDKAEVTIVVRSKYQQIVRDGYTVNSVTYGNYKNWRSHNVAPSVAEAFEKFGPFDFLVLSTKNIPDGSITCEDIIRPAVSEGTTILLFQNGIGIDEPMRKAFPKNILLLGILLIGSTVYGTVVENVYKDILTLSPFNGPGQVFDESMAKLEQFVDLYRNPDPEINYIKVEECSKRSRWEKLVYNAVFNTMCALLGADINRSQIMGANETLFRPAMKEVIALAASEGVTLDELVCDKFFHLGDGLFHSPSMLVDYRKRQLCEVEVILGNPVRIAQKNGISAPILTTVYHLLKIKQFYLKEELGMVKIDVSDYQGNSSDDFPERFAELSKISER